MTLMAAGVACLAVSLVWHVGLALLSARAAARSVATATTVGRVGEGDGGSAAPSVLWLVLVNPTPATLTATRAVGLRLRCRTRAVAVVSDPSQHERPDQADMHRLVVPPRLDRAEVLNRAYRLIRARGRDYGEDPTRTVVGIIDAGASPDEGLAVAVWQAFRDPRVGAVQARVRIVGADGLGAAEQYERGVLADAVNLLRSRRGRAHLSVNGTFVRLSELARLGPRPWRPGAPEDHGLGVRLRRLGVLIRHCPDVRVLARGTDRRDIVRRYTRAVQGRLSAWPSPLAQRLRWERLAWARRVITWPLPGLVAMWVLAAFSAAAWRLLAGEPPPPADAPRWHRLLWTVMAMDTPSWWALLQTAAVWTSAVLVPVVAWWFARRDQTLGSLVRGALVRPRLLLVRPVAFAVALGRAMLGRRATDPIGEPNGTSLSAGPDGPRARAVFVDATGRRSRRLWTVAYATSILGMAYVVVVGFALAGGQVVPHGGVGDRPRVAFPMPAPTPEANEPTPTDEPTGVSGGERAVWRDTSGPAPASETAPPVTPSPSPEPTPSDEPVLPGEPTPSEGTTPDEPVVDEEPPSQTEPEGDSAASDPSSSESTPEGGDGGDDPTQPVDVS